MLSLSPSLCCPHLFPCRSLSPGPSCCSLSPLCCPDVPTPSPPPSPSASQPPGTPPSQASVWGPVGAPRWQPPCALTPSPGPAVPLGGVPSPGRSRGRARAPRIFTYFAEPDLGQLNGSAHTGRETGAADCSMCIRQLRLNDSGAYTVAVRQPASASAPVTLSVPCTVPLTQPAVTPDNATVTENDTVTLSCRSPPGTETVAWLHDGAPVAAGGRLSLSPDNRTLTVRPVQRGDAGAYACQVSNAISTNRSDAATVTVVYGPDAVTVTPAGPLDLPAGSPLTLTCAAAAVPTPHYTWFFGETRHPGATWVLDRLSLVHGGGYVCQALNPHSGRGRNSSRLELRVWGE
uniref:Ig-like domain-containing protein n=1 Tax=Strix occidentalis caurina TaxID=311401 RepID=A0A8D0FTR2_STROC